MKHLVSVQHNAIYKKVKSPEGEEVFEPFYEIVLLLDTAKYKLANNQMIVRERKLEDLRFMVSSESLEVLINDLTEIKNKKHDEFN